MTDGSHGRNEMQIRLKSFSNICLPFFLIYDIQIVRIIHRDRYFQVLILISFYFKVISEGFALANRLSEFSGQLPEDELGRGPSQDESSRPTDP